MTNYHQCPNCFEEWGVEEISFQVCDHCGYPEDTDEWRDTDEEYDEPECRECGCTQHNACPGGCYWVSENLCSKCI